MKVARGVLYRDVNSYLTSQMFVGFTFPKAFDSREFWVIYTLGDTQIMIMYRDSPGKDVIVWEAYRRDRDTFGFVKSITL